MEVRHNRQGIPALAGYLGLNSAESTGKTSTGRRRRVGSFPEARPANREAPETLWPTWVLNSGETGAQNVGVSPGRHTRCAESGYLPERDWSSAEDGCSRTKVITVYWTIIV